jgi:hypothetical protein
MDIRRDSHFILLLTEDFRNNGRCLYQRGHRVSDREIIQRNGTNKNQMEQQQKVKRSQVYLVLPDEHLVMLRYLERHLGIKKQSVLRYLIKKEYDIALQQPDDDN